MLLAAALGFAAAIAASYLFGPEFPDMLPELAEREGFPSFPVVRLTVAVAAIRVAGPYLAVPMRRVGHRLVVAMSIAALVLSYGTVSAVIGGLAMGVAASSAIHLIFGSGLGIPSRARIIAALEEMHLDVVDVEYLDRQHARATVVRAQVADGDDLLAKVFGRDAADAAFASTAVAIDLVSGWHSIVDCEQSSSWPNTRAWCCSSASGPVCLRTAWLAGAERRRATP